MQKNGPVSMPPPSQPSYNKPSNLVYGNSTNANSSQTSYQKCSYVPPKNVANISQVPQMAGSVVQVSNIQLKSTVEETSQNSEIFAFQREFCLLCNTTDHNTIDCPEPPPNKITRIRELNLCRKCLDPSHPVTECPNKVFCGKCQLEHLEYIFHTPDNWPKENIVSVDKELLVRI